MVAADAWRVGRIDGEPELATNAEEESEWGEAVCEGDLRHCNEWVECVGEWMLGRRWKCSKSCL